MAAIIIVLSIGAPLCLVVIILGCLNCFMKRKPGFSPFSNPNFAEEGTAGQNNDAFAIDMEPASTPSNESRLTIEPIPDIAPKIVPLPPLRPKIVSIDTGSQNASLSFLSSHRPFPRENLTYLNPLGIGWFGQVIQSEALRISTGSMRSQVVVKMLKDDASSVEEKQFIEEILPFRYLDHSNVISLLGQCTESRPYLYIVEYAANGDLKSFLQSYKQNMDVLLKKNKLLHFCLDAAAGVACIHRHNFVHCDLATRNCLVMSDYKVKIGDYGFAEQTFKEDYYQSENELLPIRWMAPECIAMKEGGNTWFSQNYSKASDIWSFGVLLWEVFSMAEQPYDMLTDEAVLQGVVIDKVVSLTDIPLRVQFHDRLSALMSDCWKDPDERISIESIHQVLDEMSKEKVERVTDELDFDQKWNHLIPNTQSRSQSLASEDGSAIALAGSFSSEIPFNIDDKTSSSTTLNMEIVTQSSDMSNENALMSNDVPIQKPLNEEINLFPAAKGSVSDEVPNTITPSKKSSQQMTTSTPLPEKSMENDTPNASSSHYVTAEDGLIGDNSILESSNVSQVDDTNGFNLISSPEGNKTVEESEIEILENSMKGDSSINDLLKEKSSTQNSIPDFDSFDGASGQENVEKTVGATVEPDNKVQEFDTSFDIIVPSMLDEDQETASPQLQTPSPSQNASFDFITDINDKMSTEDKYDFAATNEVLQPDDSGNRPSESLMDDDFSFGSVASQSSATTMPFNSSNTNPFSTLETTSSQDADIICDKSNVGASSSLNSSNLLNELDTSFPGNQEQRLNDGSESMQQSDTPMSFAEGFEGPKDVSSPVNSTTPFSYLDTPPVESPNTVTLDSNLDPIKNTSDSLLPGFEPGISSNANTVLSSSPSNQWDDLVGSTPSAQTAPSDMAPFFSEGGTNPPVLASDPFDFSAFETNSNPAVPEIQQKPVDIFSSGFHELDKEAEGQKSDPFSSFDFLGDTTPAAATTVLPGITGEDLLASGPSSGDNKVGTSHSTTVCKCDDSNSLSNQSEEDESGVVNTCHSLTESRSTLPVAAASTSASDSCYISGVVSDSRNVEEMSSSEEISSRAFATSDSSDEVCDVDYDIEEHCSDSKDAEDESSADNSDVDKGSINLDGSLIHSVKLSNSEECSSEETSSNSSSEREYICVNPLDTGQPPPTFDPDVDDKENLDPDYVDKDISFDDLNEQDLKIVSEIYLSKGVKSPRVFEIPALETIPEHQPLHSVTEEAIPTPSETSSIGPRDDELFGCDSYEWDDFYGNSLIGKDDTGPELELRQSPIGGEQNNISNWSLEFESDYSSNASSVLSHVAAINRSESSCVPSKDNDNNLSSISDHQVRSLSDSEIFISKNSTGTTAIAKSSRPSLVASTLAKHRQRSLNFSSPFKNSSARDKGNFYSLMEDFDEDLLGSSQEEINSPTSLSDDDEFAFSDDGIPHLGYSSSTIPSCSTQSSNPSTPPLLPATTFPINSSSLSSSSSISSLHASALSPKKFADVLAKEDAVKVSKISSTPDVNSSTSSPPMDLFDFGLDPVSPPLNDNHEISSSVDQGLDGKGIPVSNTHDVNTNSTSAESDYSLL